ncbi:MAG: hypothetical protein KA224_02555 [Steroidobacteraceae bacterium]|nr:hypothetical protein [Steroidobacteraceae bacterium]MBP8176166.1 hypothetical protein [Xanthomonadales bacterium]
MSYAGAHNLRPDRILPEPRQCLPMPAIAPARGSRWVCSYCAGVRLGDSCEGCGAPRSEGRQLRPNVQQPAPDVR